MKYWTEETLRLACSLLPRLEVKRDRHASEKDDGYFYRQYAKIRLGKNGENLPLTQIQEQCGKDRLFWESVSLMESCFPEPLVFRIADIRLAVLGFAAPEQLSAVRRELRRIRKTVKNAEKKSASQRKKQKKHLPPLLRNIRLHDARLSGFHREKDDLLFTAENVPVLYCGKKKWELRLRNCTLLRQDGELDCMTVLAQEIYAVDGGIEWHWITDEWQCFTLRFCGAEAKAHPCAGETS